MYALVGQVEIKPGHEEETAQIALRPGVGAIASGPVFRNDPRIAAGWLHAGSGSRMMATGLLRFPVLCYGLTKGVAWSQWS
jgi:hypothetical protein